MADTEKDQGEKDPKSRTFSQLSLTSNEFNPIANSTAVDIDDDQKVPSSSQPQTPNTREKPKSEKDHEPPPHSVCFADQTFKEETTRPIGPMQNSDKIVSETQDVINNIFQLMVKQRRFLLLCAYQISSLKSIVQDHYDPHLRKIETFLTYSNGFQTEWFFQYYRLLPRYADYALVLKDRPNKVVVDEIPNSVEESTLKYLTEDVINNMFAGGLQVKVQRSLNMDVNLKMDVRKEAFLLENLPIQMWMELLDTQCENAKRIEGICFDLFSSVDLLNVDVNLNKK